MFIFKFNHQYMVHTYRPIQHNVYTRYASLIGIGNRFWLWFGYDKEPFATTHAYRPTTKFKKNCCCCINVNNV